MWHDNKALILDNYKWLIHIYRENNSEADAMADIAASTKAIFWNPVQSVHGVDALQIFFDGSAGKRGLALVPAAGIIVQAASSSKQTWTTVASLGVPLKNASTSMLSETSASVLAVLLVQFIVTHHNLPDRTQIDSIIEDSGVEIHDGS